MSLREDGCVSRPCSHVASSLHDRALSGYHRELFLVISGSFSELMLWFPRQNHVCFWCSATRGHGDYYYQPFLHISWICARQMMRYSKSVLLRGTLFGNCSGIAGFSFLFFVFFVRLRNRCSSLLQRSSPSLRCSFYKQSCCKLIQLVSFQYTGRAVVWDVLVDILKCQDILHTLIDAL